MDDAAGASSSSGCACVAADQTAAATATSDKQHLERSALGDRDRSALRQRHNSPVWQMRNGRRLVDGDIGGKCRMGEEDGRQNVFDAFSTS